MDKNHLEIVDNGYVVCNKGISAGVFKKLPQRSKTQVNCIGSAFVCAENMVFVCLGYIDGEYPKIKPRNEVRSIYIDSQNK